MTEKNKIQFDALCFNKKCIQNERGLFEYNTDTFHKSNHSMMTKIINLKYLNELLNKRQENSVQKQLNFQRMYAMLQENIDKNCKYIVDTIKNQYYEDILSSFHKQSHHINIKNANQLKNRLSNGDHLLLKNIQQYIESGRKIGLSEFMKQLVLKKKEMLDIKIQKIGKNVLQIMKIFLNEDIKQVVNGTYLMDNQNKIINDQIQVQFNFKHNMQNFVLEQNKNNQDFQNNQEENIVKRETQQQNQNIHNIQNASQTNQIIIQGPLQEQSDSISQRQDYFTQYQIKRQYIHNNNNLEKKINNQKEKQQKSDKSRKIKKQKIKQRNKTKKYYSDFRIYRQKQSESYQLISGEQIQKIEDLNKNIKTDQQHKSITIYQANKPLQTFKWIQQKYSNYKQIIIFDSNFAIRQVIISIFKKFKQLEKLIFNCNHQFDLYILKQIDNKQSQKIKKLELRWDFNDFFNKFNNFHFFRQKSHQDTLATYQICALDKINLKFKNNETIIFHNVKQFKNVQEHKKSFDSIKVLHLVNDLKKIYKINEILFQKSFTKLNTLNLERVSISLSDKRFQKLIINNPHLKTIRLICLQIDGQNNEILRALASLSNLTNLEFQSKQNNNQQINANQLFNLVHLQSLTLIKIFFQCQEGNPANSSCLRQIKKLSQLKNLNLFYCYPVCNDIFEYLEEGGILPNIKFLGLCATQVDDNCQQYLIKMNSLSELDVEQVNISGKVLASVFEQMYIKNGTFCKLKYLNAGQYDRKNQNDNIKLEQQIESSSQKEMNQQSLIDQAMRKKNLVNQERHSIQSIKKLAQYAPKLIYLNVQNCYNLKDYNFQDFKQLQILCVNPKLKKLLPILPNHIKIYVELKQNQTNYQNK